MGFEPYGNANAYLTSDGTLMISFFRRALSSWIILGLLGLVLVAFIVTGVSTPDMGAGGSGAGATIARAGGAKISSNELLRRVQNEFTNARRQQPGLDQKAFLAGGGFEGVTDTLISARALESWGKQQGMVISKRLIDADIAAISGFRGVTGQFDETAMRNALAQAGISEKELRAGIAIDLLRRQVVSPAVADARASGLIARPYATILLEQRTGLVGIIPFAAVQDSRPPSDAEIAAAYNGNIAAYTRPEARVLRYALFGAAQVAAEAAPTEADIATYYRENAATYAARDSRTLSQVITPNEATARSIAAAARAGGSLAAAAARAGLEAATLTGQNRADYAGASSEVIAAQVFAAPQGGIAGPVKGAFGWYVVRIDAITGVPARSLDQVRPEIAALLTQQKAQEALADFSGRIEDAVADGSSFAEVAASNKLTIVETPAILSTGQPVDQPEWKAPAELAPLLKPGFDLSADDRPVVEAVVKDQQYALLTVAKIVPPTPLPLAQVREAVIRDIIVKRTAARARALGQQVTAAVNRGVTLANALADTGLKLPPPQPARARAIDLSQAQQSGQQVPQPLQALFELRKGKAKMVPGPQGDVIFISVLDTITPGDLSKAPGLAEGIRRELSQAYSAELGEQFLRAVQQDVSVKRYPEAIAAVRRQFAGGQ